ncbi:MAG TPA: hypothetical protein VKU41_06420 [Polyangiaceae bacterium]|nr:hypothetical protein [Polyangiaceae bacterium]
MFTSKLLESVPDAEAGHVEAIIWARDASGAPWALLVLERAVEVFDHLVDWSEGSPASWFTVAWSAAAGEYAVALLPCTEKSVERYRLACRLGVGEEPSCARCCRSSAAKADTGSGGVP